MSSAGRPPAGPQPRAVIGGVAMTPSWPRRTGAGAAPAREMSLAFHVARADSADVGYRGAAGLMAGGEWRVTMRARGQIWSAIHLALWLGAASCTEATTTGPPTSASPRGGPRSSLVASPPALRFSELHYDNAGADS